jgi:AcrR family transcriptional regulator
MTDETELPDDVALLWGMRDAARRGPKATLTADDITRAAVAVADADGLGAVSMARVATELGNSTMALYRHVRSKDELLALMADAALEGPPVLPPDTDWRTGLMLWAQHILASVRKHPWYAQLPIGAPPIGPTNLAWFDSALQALSATGLDEPEKVGVVMATLTFVHGETRLRTSLSAGYAANPEAFGSRYGELLKRLVDPRRMPALSAVVEAGVFDQDNLYEEAEADEEFTFGFSLFLDGVERFIEARVEE